MFEYMNDIKSASRRQRSEKQKIMPMGKETRYTGVPQYIIDRNQEPIQRKLNHADIQAIMNSEIDQRLKTEFQRIYEGNKDNIEYSDSKKGGEAYIKDGHLAARIVDDRSIIAKICGRDDRIGAIVRQSTILHELTHLAVIDYNTRRDYTGIPGSVNQDELHRISSSEKSEQDILAEVDNLGEIVSGEEELLSGLRHVFSGTARNLFEYVAERILYIRMSNVPRVEYPAVVNELNYLLSKLGGEYSTCETARRLKALAEENFILRKLKRD